MRTTMKTKFIKLTLVTAAIAMLAGCSGQSSNPMQKYSNLKTGLPTDTVSETQKYAPDVFTSAMLSTGAEINELKLQGPNEVNTANFLEGKEGILYFKILPKSPKITQHAVEITDFSINSRPVLIVTSVNNVYGLHWTPPMGVVPSGKLYVTLQLKIKTTVVKATDENLNGLIKTDVINIYVSRDNSVPKILGRTKLEAGIDEGQVLPFTIDIEDPASAMITKFPEIQITSYAYANTEAFRADGARYMTMDYTKKINPENIDGNKSQWRFHYLIQVDQLPLDRDRRGIENPMAPSVDVCFHVRAISVIQTHSDQQQICFKGRYAAQPPVLKWEDESLKEIQAGAPTVLKFKILTTNNLGTVSLNNANAQIAGLTGKKELTCTNENNNPAVQSCELTWTPTCLKAPLTKKLTLKVDSVLSKKTKTESFTKEFSVVPSEVNCPPPAVAKPAVQPAQKPTVQPTTVKPATKPAVQPDTTKPATNKASTTTSTDQASKPKPKSLADGSSELSLEGADL